MHNDQCKNISYLYTIVEKFKMNKPNESKEIKSKFDMYFHSAFRNVGLFTSLSFGALAYSRVYRGKTPLYDAILISISLLFLLLSFTMNYILNGDIKQYLEHNPDQEKENIYLMITNTVFVIHGVLVSLGLGTLTINYLIG